MNTTDLSHRNLANVLRVLSMDSIQKAGSGHPGAPMGMADMAEVLWRHFLKHNPANPGWPDRDRFVLSNGHASMLLYALLHLTGYDLTIEDLQNFRQLHSRTPGHPEYNCTPGVETTTGPLGQGIANAVGMALAEKTLASRFNRPGHTVVDHYTWVFLGDGCLMEGISHEVCSLAGTLQLGKLIALYDSNGISIDGQVKGWFTDDTAQRFRAYGWHVISGIDGHNPQAISGAIRLAQQEAQRPSLLICNTIIGFGSPGKAGSEECHGAPLGEKEIALTRSALNWEYPPFVIPDEYYVAWNNRAVGQCLENEWQARLAAYETAWPQLAAEFKRQINRELPGNWNTEVEAFISSLQQVQEDIPARKASQNTLEVFGKLLPELLGGSADLTPSNLTTWSGSRELLSSPDGNYIHYGVREFGMSAMINGMALHCGFIPYGATFLMFMEYACNALRMAALMKLRAIFVYTHDSIGLGEDGPTHQPVEQLACLRMIPNMSTWRPCDRVETAVAWRAAIERQNGPSALVFSRQSLKQQPRTAKQLANIQRGGYILQDCSGIPDLILIATGSEVSLAMDAAAKLTEEGERVRVVSMPATDVFDKQDGDYRDSVLPPEITRRIAIEAGIDTFWYKYIGLKGQVVGMTRFGESAPAAQLFNKFGFTVAHVVSVAHNMR